MSHIDSLPPLREVIATHGLSAKKQLGQNFLLDLNITQKIAKTCGNLEDTVVVEVGPGPGGLTRALLSSGAQKVIAVERDERCLAALAEISEAWPGKLTVINDDALRTDWLGILADHGVNPLDTKVHIAANLPYNIATPLLTGWLSSDWPPFWSGMTLMFQKEVAERITAIPGDKAWGRLGVLAGWRSFAACAFDLPPSAFTPPPKVTSTVVSFEPRPDADQVPVEKLEAVTRAAFGQRRKMLRQSLKSLGGASLLETAGLNPTMRAEELATSDFLNLARLIDVES